MSVIFDIETGPLPMEQLHQMMPAFVPPPPPGEFDESSVRTGNLKDETKIRQKIDEARQRHEELKSNHATEVERLAAEHERSFVERAALYASTGQVVAVGYRSTDTGKSLIHGQRDGIDERSILDAFWSQFAKLRSGQRRLVGFNSNSFDVPFLMRRSWIVGVAVPATVRPLRYLDATFVDLREIWLCGQWGSSGGGESSSLDHVAKSLGVGAKPEDTSGADFARLWFGSPDEREQAVKYLANDLEITFQVGVRLGAV